jgi:hypothetical protein
VGCSRSAIPRRTGPALKGGAMKIISKPFLLLVSLGSFPSLNAGHTANTITKYFTNFGNKTVTVVVETSMTENGQLKADKTKERDIAPGARNIAIVIPGNDLYQIDFTVVSREHPDKVFSKGQGINKYKYFAIDNDMMVEMQKTPFS